MKVIKIKTCFDCPLVDIVDHEKVVGGVFKCEALGATLKKYNTEICAFVDATDDIPIPEWCPLEDAE